MIKTFRRDQIIWAASVITSRRADPAAVLGNAGPLLQWVQEAADWHDLEIRMSSLDRATRNLIGSKDGVMDDPAELVRRAGILYEFTAQGRQRARVLVRAPLSRRARRTLACELAVFAFATIVMAVPDDSARWPVALLLLAPALWLAAALAVVVTGHRAFRRRWS